jgi:hypothetical protein
MPEAAVALGCVLSGPERIPCDATFVIDCGATTTQPSAASS